MEYFYQNWKQGMSKPAALRRAQIALKNIPQYSHPYYWAPFVMIGDWQ
jgi:CHAT domain-containing protein